MKFLLFALLFTSTLIVARESLNIPSERIISTNRPLPRIIETLVCRGQDKLNFNLHIYENQAVVTVGMKLSSASSNFNLQLGECRLSSRAKRNSDPQLIYHSIPLDSNNDNSVLNVHWTNSLVNFPSEPQPQMPVRFGAALEDMQYIENFHYSRKLITFRVYLDKYPNEETNVWKVLSTNVN
ncbi:MAG: hypothetical protein ISR65_18050 [Bacteriovoracaceae bacterium]|nr:hypothetical protein [Bacteriovoracaceae bacterium]